MRAPKSPARKLLRHSWQPPKSGSCYKVAISRPSRLSSLEDKPPVFHLHCSSQYVDIPSTSMQAQEKGEGIGVTNSPMSTQCLLHAEPANQQFKEERRRKRAGKRRQWFTSNDGPVEIRSQMSDGRHHVVRGSAVQSRGRLVLRKGKRCGSEPLSDIRCYPGRKA
jgi:hypothetical protein